MLTIIDYSDKALAVIGETFTYREKLKQMRGGFNKFLKVNGETVPGWIFSKRREAEIREFVLKLRGDDTTPEQDPKQEQDQDRKQEQAYSVTVDSITERPPHVVQAKSPRATAMRDISEFRMFANIVAKCKQKIKLLPNDVNFKNNAGLYFNGESYIVLTGTNLTGAVSVSDMKGAKEIKQVGEKFIIDGVSINARPCSDNKIYELGQEIETDHISRELSGKIISAHKFTGKDELRPSFSYVRLSGGKCYATDTHKMFFTKMDLCDMELNPSAVTFLAEVGSANVVIYKRYIKLYSGNVSIVYPRFDGTFPNYSSVIPTDNPILLKTSKSEIVPLIKKSIDAANKETGLVKFSFCDGTLTISGEDVDRGSEFSGTAKYDGPDITIGFNGKKMLECLSVCSETLEISADAPNRCIIINESVLLMPMMLA